MSTNCLVTKLKSVVDNDSLPKLGQLVYKVSGRTEYTLYLNGPSGSNIRVSSNTITSVVTNTQTVTLPYTFIPGPSGQVMFNFNTQSADDVADIIFERYGDIPGIDVYRDQLLSTSLLIEGGLKALNYGNFIGLDITFTGNQNIGNIEDLKIKAKRDIFIVNTNITGNVSSYLNSYSSEEKQALRTIDFYLSGHLEGDVQSFSECTSCTYLRIQDAANITGNIETMLDNMVVNGRQSGQMNLRLNSSVVKPSEITGIYGVVTFVPISETYPKGYYITI